MIIIGLPSSANTGKFSEGRTTANLALKFHSTARLELRQVLPLLPNDAATWAMCIPLTRKLPSLVYRSKSISDCASYFSIREADPLEVRRLYNFRTTTSAGCLQDLFLISSLDNAMKKAEEMDAILDRFYEFGKVHYLNTHGVFLVGDFYVWKNALHALWKSREQNTVRTIA